jgi:hypothetical protein
VSEDYTQNLIEEFKDSKSKKKNKKKKVKVKKSKIQNLSHFVTEFRNFQIQKEILEQKMEEENENLPSEFLELKLKELQENQP